MSAIPRQLRGWGLVVVCLGFTLPGTAVAEEARDTAEVRARWVDDPYEPHETYGPNLRVGSAVGWMVHEDKTYTALGGAVAIGPRVGRFALEAGYVYAELSEPGPSTLALGNVHRLSINGRADLIRLGSRSLGPNSMLAIYGEAGVARQLHHWYKPSSNAARRILPVDAGRSIAVFGFGLNLDHRLEQPPRLPVAHRLAAGLAADGVGPPGARQHRRVPRPRVRRRSAGAARARPRHLAAGDVDDRVHLVSG